ncbi:ATP-binding protein [Sorangium sp. So ce1151]|uniref:ATP-binding protein n=1 Tax=Sorangium sp. So ce1151 TaxID=3133332 RepID=UPI003F63A72D
MLLLATFSLVLGAPAPALADEAPASVLVFVPDDSTAPAMATITGELRQAVQAGWSGPVTFKLEYIDLAWFDTADYARELRRFYRVKYSSYHPGVIVALRLDVLRVVLELRRELWPGVPVLFMAEDQAAALAIPAAPDVTGIWIEFAWRRTAETALRLFPDTREVAVVAGASPWERARRAGLDGELRPLADRVALLDLAGLPLAELDRRLATLPEGALVLFDTFYMDGAGQRFVGLQVFERVRAHTQRPFFSVHGVGLGKGVVGGVMVDYGRLGRDLGGMTLRLLGGERASSIPVRAADATQVAFDARELARFQIPEDRLPPGAEVHFRMPSFWELYRRWAMGAAAVVTIQATLIAGLIIERRRRGRAQAMGDAVLASMAGFVAVLDEAGVLRRANQAWSQPPGDDALGPLAGVTEGRSYLGAFGQAAAAGDAGAARVVELVEGVLAGRAGEGTVEYHHPGTERWIEVRARRLSLGGGGAVVSQFDVTGRKRAENEARESLSALSHLNRVAAMGELASSIAHEINQPLSAILTNAQATEILLGRAAPDVAGASAALAEIVTDARRAGLVVRRTRTLMKRGEVQIERCDLNEAAREVARLAGNDALLRGATIVLELAPDLPAVRGDAVQLQQVALNLVSNALDAVSEGPPGGRRVSVRTARAGGRVALTVEDSGERGAGDDPERFFAPFFTTKPAGLGLGLSISRSIAAAHGGRLWAERAPGGGMVVRLELPGEAEEEER